MTMWATSTPGSSEMRPLGLEVTAGAGGTFVTTSG